jgi:TPR repeat protein
MLLACLCLVSCFNNPLPDRMRQRGAGNWQGHQGADAGVAEAQYEQAKLYAEARGAERNLVLAYKLAKLAAFQGHVLARELRDKLRKEMTAAGIEEGDRLAAEFRPTFK